MSDYNEKTERLKMLYPEIISAGQLSHAIAQMLTTSWKSIEVSQESESPFWTSLRKNDRLMRATVSTDEHMFISDFWWRGTHAATLKSSTLEQVAEACRLWLVDSLTLQSMSLKIPDFKPTEMAYEFEAGRGVEANWRYFLSPNALTKPTLAPLGPLIREAAKQPLLRQLFPYQSMNSLRFSRTTGHPYTNDCPWAEVIGIGSWDEPANFRRYRAVGPDGTILGEGTARDVVGLLVKFLPVDVGPAVNGTAEDLKSRTPGTK